VVTVGDQGRAVDFATDPNAEHRHRFVADKSNDPGDNHPRKEANRLRMDQALDGLIAGEDGTEHDDRHDDHAGQVFNPPKSIGERLTRLATCQHERDPERDCGHCVSDIVDRISEQRDAARDRHDEELQHRRDCQHDKRPFDGPDALRRGRDGGIYHAVGMAVTAIVVHAPDPRTARGEKGRTNPEFASTRSTLRFLFGRSVGD
jgi:hypothetical protein